MSDSGERNRRPILRKESSMSSLGESPDGQSSGYTKHSSDKARIMTSTVHIVPREVQFPVTFDAQNVRIYNDTDFKIFYSFCSTRPNAFHLSDPEGQLQPKHYRDITINILDKTVVEDIFRIRFHHVSARGQRVGEKVLPITVKSTSVTDDELRLRNSGSSSGRRESGDQGPDSERLIPSSSNKNGRAVVANANDNFPNEYIIYFALMLCIFLLYLPNVHERDPNWPEICHVTIPVKIAAAYILGIITVMILRK